MSVRSVIANRIRELRRVGQRQEAKEMLEDFHFFDGDRWQYLTALQREVAQTGINTIRKEAAMGLSGLAMLRRGETSTLTVEDIPHHTPGYVFPKTQQQEQE